MRRGGTHSDRRYLSWCSVSIHVALTGNDGRGNYCIGVPSLFYLTARKTSNRSWLWQVELNHFFPCAAGELTMVHWCIATVVFDTRIFRSFYVRPIDVDSRFNVMAWTMGAEAGVEPATTGL